jgi:hypothetical protein
MTTSTSNMGTLLSGKLDDPGGRRNCLGTEISGLVDVKIKRERFKACYICY